MKVSWFSVILALLCTAAFVLAQSEPPFVRIIQGKGKTAGQFVEDKTTVVGIEYVGLDVDQREYGIDPDDAIYEKNLLSELRYRNVGLNIDETFQAYKIYQVEKTAREWLDEKGYPRATVLAFGQMVGEAQMQIKYVIERGNRLTRYEVTFSGNKVVRSGELIEDFEECANGRGVSKTLLEYCAQKHSRSYMWSKGFFKAKITDVSFSLRKNTRVTAIKVNEGPQYRVGDIKIEGNKVFSGAEILAMYGQNPGDIIDGRRIQTFIYEELKSKYGELGYAEFDADFEPILIDPKKEGTNGICNLELVLNEGQRFLVRKIIFSGVDETAQNALLAEFPLKPGDIYVRSKAAAGIDQINESAKFQFLDIDRHVEIRTDSETADIDLFIKITNR
jgi:outer membrane protein assembly factor BamA